MHTRQDRRIQTALAFTLAKNVTKPNPFEIVSLQTTRKENNWKTEETLARAVVTLETERIRRSNPWCLWWWFYCSTFSYSGNSEGDTINVHVTDECRELTGEVNNKQQPCAILYVLFPEVERISVCSRSLFVDSGSGKRISRSLICS